MDVNSIAEVALGLLVGLGGGGAIAGGVSSLLGKYLVDRFLEEERAKHAESLEETRQQHARELESLKSEFERELEYYRSELARVSARFERYDARQFETYGQIWVALYDLRLAADSLWTNASASNLERFTRQFQNTRDTTERLSLYIEDEHARELQGLLKAFGDFEMGKRLLRDLRTDPEIRAGARAANTRTLVDTNRQIRERYSALIKDIRRDFKAQLTSSGNTVIEPGPTKQPESTS